ncbi:MAG: flagellar assembly peptidoglycan hydrolase FlgJ [Rhodoferax sp.]
MALNAVYGPASYDPFGNLAADAQSLGQLKAQAAGQASPETIQETARQFESLFMRELVKSMRQATEKTGLLDSPGSDLATDLLDQQLAVQMSGQPGGLGELIAQQLARQSGVSLPFGPPASAAGAAGATGASTPTTAAAPKADPAPIRKLGRAPTDAQSDFVRKHSDIANRVEAATGIPAAFMIGQAGHETGWGRFEIKAKGGQPSYNLFGIKAGASWSGKVAEVTTTEYVDGVAQKKVAKFRAYGSYEEAFRDYARLISESPRYEKVRAQGRSVQGFATGLQKAGYATDPEYAAKLSRAINTTLHLRRVQV